MLTTDQSLVERLENREDRESWARFVELYEPTIKRSLRLKGLSEVDSDDVTQQILLSVANALSVRPHDFSRAKFRTWLERVTRNAALNAMRTTKKDQAVGGTDQLDLVHRIPGEDDEDLLEQEYQRELFKKASEIVRAECDAATWDAFWLTTIEGLPMEEVAIRLKKQIGSVYAARSRIVRRLRDEVAKITGQMDGC